MTKNHVRFAVLLGTKKQLSVVQIFKNVDGALKRNEFEITTIDGAKIKAAPYFRLRAIKEPGGKKPSITDSLYNPTSVCHEVEAVLWHYYSFCVNIVLIVSLM